MTAYIIFAFIVYVLHTICSAIGVTVADRFELGDLRSDFKEDIKKMAICSLFELSLPLAIFYFVRIPQIAFIYIALWFVVTKIAYFGISKLEMFVMGLTTWIGLGFSGWIALRLLR